jgi:phage-related holin
MITFPIFGSATTATLLAEKDPSINASIQEAVSNAVSEAVKDASTRGWEAVILVLVMLGLISLTGVIVRWLIKSMDKRMEEAKEREDRMAKRLDYLENFVENTLMNIINNTSTMTVKVLTAIDALTNVLDKRPCILNPDRQDELLNKLSVNMASRGIIKQTHKEKSSSA